MPYTIRQGSTYKPVAVQLLNTQGQPLQDISTVRFSMKKKDGTTPKLNRVNMVVVPNSDPYFIQPGGMWSYYFDPADVDTPGTYACECEITFNSGRTLVLAMQDIIIEPRLTP